MTVFDSMKVTAAHCFRQKQARIINQPDPFLGRYQVKAGHTNRNDMPIDSNDSLDPRRPPLSAIQIRNIKKIAKHPKYGISSETDRDIAVIIVEKPFQLSSYVSPVCLPSAKTFRIMSGKALVSGSESDNQMHLLPEISIPGSNEVTYSK